MKKLLTRKIAVWLLAWLFVLTLIPGQKIMAAPDPVGTGPVVIYEAYGGGGNSGGVYKSDFIVLKNISDQDVDLTGWAIQYASKGGAFSAYELNGSIVAGGYYLIEAAEGNDTTQPAIPPSDVYHYITMSSSSFRVALTNDMTIIPDSTSTTHSNIIDYVGVGPDASAYLGTGSAPVISSATSLIRKDIDNPYTGDNSADFEVHTPDLSYLDGTTEPGDGETTDPDPEPALVTIEAARAATGEVKTKGVVTFIDGRNVVIQDATAAINSFLPEADAEISIGMELTVTGERGAHNNLEQISVASAEDVIKGEIKTLPAPKLVTMADLNDAAKAESMESQRVLIEEVTLDSINTGGNSVISKDAMTFNIYKIPALTGISAGEVVDVVAVLSQYYSYQLRVAEASDVTLSGDVDRITIAEARAKVKDEIVTTRGIVTFIDGRNVTIQDATGAINNFLPASDAEIVLGMELTVEGTRKSFNNVEQITVTTYEKGAVKSMPAPVVVTMEELTSPTRAEELESIRLLVKGVTLDPVSGDNTPLSKDGLTINVYRMPTLTEVSEGDTVDVTAIMSQYWTTYQLRVADADHVVLHEEVPDPVTDEMLTGLLSLKEVYAATAGDVVTTVGQVAYIYGGNSVILQDVIDGEIVGLQIYDYPNIDKYVIGEVVKVTGKTSEYGGVRQLGSVAAENIIVLGAEEPFKAQELTAKDILDGGDQYLSEFVVVRDAVLGAYSESGSTMISDTTGTIGIFRGAAFPVGVVEGDTVHVYAAASKYNTTRQLRVGASTDYVVSNDTDGPVISLPTFLPAKALKDYSVAIDVIDNVGVKTVEMVYEINGTSSEPVSMVKNDTTGKYQAVIPGTELTDTAIVKVTFTAVDVNENKTIETAEIAVEDKPQILSVTPSANAATGEEKKPVITVEFENAGTDPVVMLTLNEDAPVEMIVDGNKATYIMTEAMEDGKVDASVLITRADEVTSDEYAWSFYIGEPLYNFYFGQLHAHTNYSDGSGTPDQALTYASNAEQIDFLALTDHSNYFDSTGNLGTFENENSGLASSVNAAMSKWAEYKTYFDKYTTEDFLAIYGFEMTWSGSYGHINTFNSDGFVSRNNPVLNAKGGSGLQAYYDLLKEQEGTFSQFNHPGSTFGTFEDFGRYDKLIDEKINLIEVGNGEGAVGGSGYWPSYQYYTQALDKGWHLAPSNGQDNHKGKWGDANTARTVVVADRLDKSSIYGAISDMTVYSTEDNNFEVFYTANNQPMGTILTDSPDKLDILVDFNDPDATDVIGKVSVIVNGGIVAHSEQINSNSGKLEVSLPNDYSYYYIMAEQADGDIAVTAPVWTGEVTQVGINDMTKDTSMDVMGETTKITTHMYNGETVDFTVTNVDYLLDGELLASVTENLPVILKGTEADLTFDYVPEKVGKQTITVHVEGNLNGVSMAFTKSITLNVYNNDSVVDILVDAAHDNFYISGDYADNDTYFTAVAGQKGARVKRVNDVITEESLEGIELLMLTVPYKGFGQIPKSYTDAEIVAIRNYAENGGNIILTSKSDRGNPGGEFNAAVISNSILEAIGAKARIADGIVVDNERKSNEAYRIQFTEDANFNEDSMFGKGILTQTTKTFNAYNSAPVILNGATPIVSGYETTWGANYTENFTGSAYVPNYEKDLVVVEKGDVTLVAEEMLPGGGFLVTAGVTFFSNFEVTVEMLIEESVRNANFMILNNVIDEIKPEPVITPIAEVQKAEEGLQFTIRGRLTSNVSGFDKSTAFFDSAYIQDETGGINIFPIDGNYEAGTMLEITGITSSYQGEHQLNISSMKVMDEPVVKVQPKMMQTSEVSYNLGLLVQVEGIVREIEMVEGIIEAIHVEDESGVPVRVFIDGYIGTDVVMPDIEEGDFVNAIGLSSIDPHGTRIRVRDRSEVTLAAKATDKAELEEILETAELISLEDMTEESAEALQEAIAAAKAILEDEFATQEEVDDASEALLAAIEALEPVEEPGTGETAYVLKDNKTGVMVTVPVGAFDEKPVLVVKPVDYELSGYTTSAYEIHFTVDGVKVQPKVAVTLHLPLDKLSTKGLLLFHEKSDKKLEKLSYKLSGKIVETQTKDFSVFVLASKTGKYPATGETETTMPMVMGILMLAGGVVLLSKRKQKYIQ
ncbi:CehA/McbA family metallohydrolase [Proteiniclasticum sp. SCR006]|uniref:CehA/McbA family metallohydrolase n=1 Tax=Proteiniclasticum aestuarii TaxID=2817862 RepID=A0A939KF37_9CLOT|nr:CehA/McbA family metallohydrolase [Proteiniclasticum aestuarii]MBO1264057.1 CehA/McbA family metallohydrolase [Proteiniclasticum aestuarii]